MTHRLATNYAKNYCNRTPIVKVIAANVVTCFLGHSVCNTRLSLFRFFRSSLYVLTAHVTVCVCHTEIKGYLLTIIITSRCTARWPLRSQKRSISADEMYLTIFVEWAADHFRLSLT